MATISQAVSKGTYRVPNRFGISAILALTTLFAMLFAILRGLDAPAVVYLYFGTLAITICLGQMALGRVPRVCSLGAGACLLPLWMKVLAIFETRTADLMFVIYPPFELLWVQVLSGACLGYVTGGLMAGFFLLLDRAHSRP